MATIEDLLKSLQYNTAQAKATLENNKETWKRIASKDTFDELGLKGSELDEFLKTWIESNPYMSL